ncbi:MAG: SufE family protein [Bdellovibrionales bacterium]
METTEQKIEFLLQSFSKLSSWEERYKKIIQMGKELTPLEEEFKTEALLVKGCQSQVWLKAELQDDRTVLLKGESDSVIVQGLLALLLFVYSGQQTEEILSTSPIFLEDLGLKKHLTPNRANGVYAMVKQITYYAQAFQLLAKRV